MCSSDLELRERVETLWEQEGDAAGSEFRDEPGARRLANLVDKGAVFAELVATPEILECIEHVIGPNYKLSSLNARSANPHNGESQPLHVDAGAVADEFGYWVCNTIWMLDDFTAENGATRMQTPSLSCGTAYSIRQLGVDFIGAAGEGLSTLLDANE